MALFIVLNRDAPGFDPFVNGKSLGAESPNLDLIAARLGVKPLMEFFSASADELRDFVDSTDASDVDITQFGLERWFDPKDGLLTVCSLLSYLQENTAVLQDRDGVISDLREFERILIGAKEQGLKWHLSVDF